MSDKYSLKSFITDIDKIVFGELNIPSECDDEEYKELLFLAQVLAKADYTLESQDRIKKIKEISTRENDEMEDDELDMVAGGVDLNALLGERGKKDGI